MKRTKKEDLVADAIKIFANKIEQIPIEALRAHPNNARTHSRQQVRQLGRSLVKFGFVRPVLVDGDNQIIAGHGITDAARAAGIKTIPIVRASHLSSTLVRAYCIADNRLTEKSNWDKQTLAAELEFLSTQIELSDIGFEVPEADIIFEEAAETTDRQRLEDQLPVPGAGAATSTIGDCWLLGPHRLLCADALLNTSYQALLGGELAQFVFTDPPYNVRIQGHASGLGRKKHREFAMASGEMTRSQFKEFLTNGMSRMKAHSVDGAIHQICIDWRHSREMAEAGESAYGVSALKNICIWRKTNAGMGSLYRSQHEMIYVWVSGCGEHINNVELGKHGRSRSNVWDYAGVNSFKRGRSDELAMHPTVKPVALIADAIKDCSSRDGIILDPFGGSGTSIIAAERTGRRARTIEIDPAYVDVAVSRWEAYTGRFATHFESGKTFEEIKEERSKSKRAANDQ